MLSFVVQVIHALIILYTLIAPFSSCKQLVASYVLIAPMIMIHWATNNDQCFISQLECHVRNVPQSEGFVHKIINPVYNISSSNLGTVLWTYVIITWCYALTKVNLSDVKNVLCI
jgi:hypothetical protein